MPEYSRRNCKCSDASCRKISTNSAPCWLTLSGRDDFHLAGAVDAVFRVIQRSTAYVRRQNMDVPCISELQRISDSHGDAVRLFAGGASRAPYAKRTRVLPELLHMQLGQDLFLQCLKHRRIAEERCFLRQQPLQQRVVLHVGILDHAQQVGAVRQLARLKMLAHAAGKKTFARRVEEYARAFFNQAANLTQFMFAYYHEFQSLSAVPSGEQRRQPPIP